MGLRYDNYKLAPEEPEMLGEVERLVCVCYLKHNTVDSEVAKAAKKLNYTGEVKLLGEEVNNEFQFVRGEQLTDDPDDVCGYCGANNGPGGIAREGFNCHSCGGN